MRLSKIKRQVQLNERLIATLQTGGRAVDGLASYQSDPVAYAEDVLHISFIWEQQKEIARALLKPPYKVMVKAGHSVGKTFLAAWLVNWFFDCFAPSLSITTAPTKRDVEDLLWKEVRLQRARAGLSNHFIGPTAPEMRTGPDHYAKGFTARKGESFQGRHDQRMLFVFDEAVGVDANYWESAKTMFRPERGHAWLVIFNPTDTTSQAYIEEQTGGWRVFSLSSLEHPNVAAELTGAARPVQAAVSLSQINGWINDWCVPVREEERQAADIFWGGRWWRPGAEFESRALGRWPSQGTYSVWSEALWDRCKFRGGAGQDIRDVSLVRLLANFLADTPHIGCDVARYGDDKTAFHVRYGCYSIHHESSSGLATTETAGRLVELCREYAVLVDRLRKEEGAARPVCDPRTIPVKVDDDGVGGGVTDRLFEQGYNVVPVRAGTRARNPARYPNKRSELWFSSAERAADMNGMGVWLGRLEDAVLIELRRQAMAPRWKLDSAGRRVVESKDDTKEKIGRSPDDMDAVNLAYWEEQWEPPSVVESKKKEPAGRSPEWKGKSRRKLFGR